MPGSIYLLHDDGDLVEMRETRYDSEELLQNLLARYPNLLAGEQMNSDDPRRWILVRREMGVPDSGESGGRWSLDHLFLDQEAVPTLVEVKRSTDTRSRREVVAQMLDYAANAVVYWPVEKIQSEFEATCAARGVDPYEEAARLVGDESQMESFWQGVKTNLQAGRIRMVFVADVIPTELRRIIEFLNTQMDPAEVLGVEVKQYVGVGMKTLVPRVIGQTEESISKKAAPSGRDSVDEPAFWSEFKRLRPAAEEVVAKQIIEWSRREKLVDHFKSSERYTDFVPHLNLGRKSFILISLRSRGDVGIQMKWIKNYSPFSDRHARDELSRRLADCSGVILSPEKMEGFPSIRLAELCADDRAARFIETLSWMVQQLRASSGT